MGAPRPTATVTHSSGRDIIAIAGDVVINVAQTMAALGARVALAPPQFGDWGLLVRERDLARLHDDLCRHGQGAVVAVAGLGGLGKTALALGYLDRYGAGFDLVAWGWRPVPGVNRSRA